MKRLADLREILRYVPQYRERLFVIALDGAIVDDPNHHNLLLDIALLRSLRIRVVLVHGAGHQIEQLARQRGVTPSNIDGTGVTDAATLELALTAAHQVTHKLLEGITFTDLQAAYSNAVVAHPAGILKGVDHQYTGRVERIDTVLLQSLLRNDIIPIIPPLGCDGERQSYRLNSDSVAVEVAVSLGAVKLIYITSEEGIKVFRKEKDSFELLRQLRVEEAETLLRDQQASILPSMVSKLQHAVRAAGKGVPRVHIIDGRVEEGLLAEVFSNQGIGTLIHANEYQAIRPAHPKDARDIYSLIRIGMETDELMQRTLPEVEEQINDFYVFEIDQLPAGCVALHYFPAEHKAEMASICVHPQYENQRIGLRLMTYVESKAREMGAKQLFCLSTQAFNYFVQKGGFQIGSPDDLPQDRRQRYDQSGRRSLVLIKSL